MIGDYEHFNSNSYRVGILSHCEWDSSSTNAGIELLVRGIVQYEIIDLRGFHLSASLAPGVGFYFFFLPLPFFFFFSLSSSS
jgi:hypothetical protein